MEVAAEDVGVQTEFAEEGFSDAAFVIIGARDGNGKPKYDRVYGIELRRAGEEKISIAGV